MIGVVPAAGLGTRMVSVTGGGPKELLPLGSKSVLARIADEAIKAGVEQLVVVSSPAKPEIASALERLQIGIPYRVAVQEHPLGLADALFTAEAEDDVLFLLGDTVFRSGSPCERMCHLVFRGIDGCVAVETVPDEEVRRYGICEVDDMGGIRRVLEKPNPSETDSRWAVAARMAFARRTLAYLEDLYLEARGERPEGEIQLASLIDRSLRDGFDFKAVALQASQQRVDCGSAEEYESARRMNWD